MSTLSAPRQVEFDFSATDMESASEISTSDRTIGRARRPYNADLLSFPQFPSFSYSAEGAASRSAGRLNASAVREHEHKKLLDERQMLLDKEFSGNISIAERNRLEYVRWSLDRIDDAKFGPELDRLQSLASQYERFQEDMERFQVELERLRRSRGGRR
jgi:hypothetical protein